MNDLLDDPRLMQAVQEYLTRLERGQTPNRQELLQRFPDLAGPLAQCLDGLELLHREKKPGNREQATGNTAAVPCSLQGDNLPAEPLGDFQVVREIGRGGMGIVYEAVQLSLGRRVALKVLPFAATFDSTLLQRFQNEAQAAAQLHHTNIVPVFAVGRERGVHFYAMQLIEGQSLAAMIRQLRQDAGKPDFDSTGIVDRGPLFVDRGPTKPRSTVHGPRSTIPTPPDTMAEIALSLSTLRSQHRAEFYRSAARFMVQAAEAVEHAHQFGIVHRDIKPGNLMVDAHGRLWVTDFGLAQFHANPALTQTGDVLGTLRYMSPEQASGQRTLLDHRTDIYSLGATLYELATLEPIFPGADRNELLHQIMNDEPRAPRTLDRNVPVELETIILKAVNKHPADRYGSAREFAADLQRFLDDKPILARRPSLLERTRKWSRRHPSFVVAAMLLLIFGVVGFAVSTALIHRSYEAERKRAGEAEQRFKLARRSADEMIRLAEEETANKPHMQDLRRLLLEAALSYYQEFIELRQGEPNAQVELAATRDRVQKILADLALLQGAGRHFLLKEATVLEDLKVSDEQRAAIAELLKKLDKQRSESLREFYKLSAQERSNRFLELVRTTETAIAKIFDPAQLKRLQQIAWQCQGPMAFREPDVVAALKLTPAESGKIRAIEDNMVFDRPFDHNHGPHQDGPSPEFHQGHPPEMPPDRAMAWGPAFAKESRSAVLEQIYQVLGKEKTRQWQEMIGPEFVGADHIFLPPCGPPPGGPDGPGGPHGPQSPDGPPPGGPDGPGGPHGPQSPDGPPPGGPDGPGGPHGPQSPDGPPPWLDKNRGP